MRGVVMHRAGDVRVEQREDPKIIEPIDAIVRLTATCICGSDLWPYRGMNQPIIRSWVTSTSASSIKLGGIDGDIHRLSVGHIPSGQRPRPRGVRMERNTDKLPQRKRSSIDFVLREDLEYEHATQQWS